MIDFRYHLVSLVSVFLALAVGIVLGAGPLQDSIGNALTVSVEKLRQEKDALRTGLDTANTSVTHRDAYLTAITPELVAGRLTGRSVVVVSLPGVDSDVAGTLVKTLDSAGGTVTGQIQVRSEWTSADAAQTREEALAKITAAVSNPGGEAGGDTQTRLDALLAGALVDTGSGTFARSTPTSRTVLDELTSADLIDVKGDLAGLAGSVLLLAPAVTVAGSQPTPTSATSGPFVPLAGAFHAAGGGTVVIGPASSATGDGLVALIRKDKDVAAEISTVDTGQTQMGLITAVLALREQVAGTAGQYGFGAGASDPLPSETAGSNSGG